MNTARLKTALWFVVLPIAGLTAALLTICVPASRILATGNPLGGLFFGVAIALCFWFFSGLRSIWNTIGFVLGSFVAAVAGMFSAMYVSGRIFEAPSWGAAENPGTLFTGGFIGGFILLAAALSAFSKKIVRVLIQSACWALTGGILAVLGYASGDWFRLIRSHFDFLRLEHSHPLSMLRGGHNDELALLIIWQTGMGLVIALALWIEKKNSAPEPGNARAASQPSR